MRLQSATWSSRQREARGAFELRDEMALNIEGVVDGGVRGKKFLG